MRMRVFALGVCVLALSPAASQAAPLVLGASGAGCDAALSPSGNCYVFDIDPFATPNLSGALGQDNDVALFRFVLTGQTSFTGSTSSYMAGGFDPTLGLFDATGTIVQYADPADPAAIYPARGTDIGVDNYDDILPTLLLDPGTYYLALMQYPNSFKQGLDGLDSLRAGFDLDDTPDFGGCAGAGACGFALALTARPIDDTPVPEPGTLSLLALGSAAAGLRRRRRTLPAAADR